MSTYRFKAAQRYAVWSFHGKTCYWCERPLKFLECTIDHVIPEHILGDPAQLKSVIKGYDLPPAFSVNDYCNWVPCHSHCNLSKGGSVFKAMPMFAAILHRLCKCAAEVRAIEVRISSDRKKDALLAKVMAAMESDPDFARKIEKIVSGSAIKHGQKSYAPRYSLPNPYSPHRKSPAEEILAMLGRASLGDGEDPRTFLIELVS